MLPRMISTNAMQRIATLLELCNCCEHVETHGARNCRSWRYCLDLHNQEPMIGEGIYVLDEWFFPFEVVLEPE